MADAAGAFAALVDSEVAGPVNIGSGTAPPVRAILEGIGRLTGRPELIDFGARPLAAGEPACIAADVTRLRAEVGFQPRFDRDAGLHATRAIHGAGA